MAKKRHTAEEIIGKLREAEVLIAQGRSVTDAAKAIGGLSEDDPARPGHGVRFARSDFWAYAKGVTLDFSRPGQPTDNAFAETFNGCVCMASSS